MQQIQAWWDMTVNRKLESKVKVKEHPLKSEIDTKEIRNSRILRARWVKALQMDLTFILKSRRVLFLTLADLVSRTIKITIPMMIKIGTHSKIEVVHC